MRSTGDEGVDLERTREAGRTLYDVVHEALVAGLAVVVPLIVTLVVLDILAGYVFSLLGRLVRVLERLGVQPATSELIVQGVVVVVILAFILAIGFVTRFRYGEQIIDYVDFAIQLIPGVGAIYESFREMSDVLIESDVQNFREVKLVEFPHEGTYTLGFLTTQTSDPIEGAADGRDLYTLFLPLAPNPVMGGHLAHVPADRVRDVDMTVEEGLRTVVTTGVATADPESDEGGLSREQLERMAAFDEAIPTVDDNDDGVDRVRQNPASRKERTAEYREWVGPDSPSEEPTPDAVRDYREAGPVGRTEETPADLRADRPGHATSRPDATPDDIERTADDPFGDAAPTPEDVAADEDGREGDDADAWDERVTDDGGGNDPMATGWIPDPVLSNDEE